MGLGDEVESKVLLSCNVDCQKQEVVHNKSDEVADIP